jgi:hypothetical protein
MRLTEARLRQIIREELTVSTRLPVATRLRTVAEQLAADEDDEAPGDPSSFGLQSYLLGLAGQFEQLTRFQQARPDRFEAVLARFDGLPEFSRRGLTLKQSQADLLAGLGRVSGSSDPPLVADVEAEIQKWLRLKQA